MMTGVLMTFLGYGVLARFNKESFLEKIGLGFLIGFGITTIPLFVLTFFHIRLNPLIIFFELSVLVLLSFYLIGTSRAKNKTFKKSITESIKQLSEFEGFLIILILLTVLISFTINWYWPVTAWDSVTLYDFRARLYAEGGLLTDLFSNVDFNVEQLSYYYTYPPITSLAHTISYAIQDKHTSIIYSFFYLSLIILFYSSVSRIASRSTTLTFTFLLATNFTIFSHSLLAYTNVPYAVYIFASFLILEKFVRSSNINYFWVGTFLSATTVLVRATDPFPFLFLVLFIIAAFEKKIFIKYTLIFAITIWLVRVFAYSHLKNDVAYLQATIVHQTNPIALNTLKSLIDPNKYREVLDYIYIALDKYYLHLGLFGLTLIFSTKKFIQKNLALILFIILSLLILIPGTLMLSTVYEGWNRVPDSLHRLVFFLYPLIFYYLSKIPEVDILFSTFSRRTKK